MRTVAAITERPSCRTCTTARHVRVGDGNVLDHFKGADVDLFTVLRIRDDAVVVFFGVRTHRLSAKLRRLDVLDNADWIVGFRDADENVHKIDSACKRLIGTDAVSVALSK
jgi:hypothetical protein